MVYVNTNLFHFGRAEQLLVVTKNGYGKRTPVKDYKVLVRGGKGLLTYDKAKFKKTGELVGAMVVSDEDEVLLINSDGIIIRIKSTEVSKLGRATQGVKIMRVAEDCEIISIAKVIKEDEELEEEFGNCGVDENDNKSGKAKDKQETDGPEQITLGEFEEE